MQPWRAAVCSGVLSLLSGAVEEAPACSSSSTAVSCCCQSASWSAPDKLSGTALRLAVLTLVLLLLLLYVVVSAGVGKGDGPWEGVVVLGVVLRGDAASSSTCSRAVCPFPAAALSCFDQAGDPTGGTGIAAAAAAAASAAAATAAACCAAR